MMKTEKKVYVIVGYLANISYLSGMKQAPIYTELLSRIALLESQLQVKDKELKHKDEDIKRKDEDIKRKEERIAYLERLVFGAKRDKLAYQGPGLFDELFDQAMNERNSTIEQTAKDIHSEAQQRRARSKSNPHRPAKYCYCGLEEQVRTVYPQGVNIDEYDEIGKDITRVLHRDPARIWVEVIERPILRLKADKQEPWPVIKQAPAPEAVIGGNHVGADLLAQLVIDKYVYHLPEYRQVKQYADMGVTLPTSTVNNWVHAVANKLYPLYEALGEDIRTRGYLQIDEVPWRIADSPGKCRKGYAWQFFDATPDSHGLYFYYHKGSRSGAIPRAQLKKFKGTIQTDGYGVYDYFEQQSDVTLLGCMAHVRRKFIEAQNSHHQLASKAVGYISLLYELEANLRDRHATPEQIAYERQQKALPIMDAMEEWMKAAASHCTPSDLLGKALDYAYKLWPRLRRYTGNGIYQIDNNSVERCQRPSVIGRKNYLFSKNDRGAEDNAVFYSLLESCQVTGVNPRQWLIYVLNNLHKDTSENQITKMIPYNYKKSQD